MEFELTFGIVLLCMSTTFAAGFIDAVAGGGGLVTMPAFLLCGIPPHCVLGTNKLASTIGALAGMFSFWRRGLVDTAFVLPGFLSGFVGGVLGSGLALVVPRDALAKVLVVLLPIGFALSLLAGSRISARKPSEAARASGRMEEGPMGRTNRAPRGNGLDDGACGKGGDKRCEGRASRSGFDWAYRLRLCLVGVGIGAYDGFFGPATGSFMIIALHLFLGMELVKASANTKVMNMASNFGAFVSFASGGVVIYALALPCAVASILGNLLGARYAVRGGSQAVRRFLYVALSLLMATLVFRLLAA